MIFSATNWLRSYAKKMDIHLRKELLCCYRHNKHTPCFLHSLINLLRYVFKRVDVIVRYSDSIRVDSERTVNGLEGLSDRMRKTYLKTINAYAVTLSPRKIKKLVEMDSVKTIYYDRKCNTLLDKASPTLSAPYAWDTGLAGKGIAIAVIDTGIYPHDDITKPVNRIIAFKDFIKNKKNPYDDNGHGTHVAGCIASNGIKSDGLYKAPACESLLVGVKVLDKFGKGNTSKVISGIEWCMENKENYGIRCICLSLGSEAAGSYKDDPLCEAVEAAWNDGIAVFAAAGNDGPQYGTITSPGTDPLIITVGAVDDRGTVERSDDSVAGFSSRGPTVDDVIKPDVVSPGVDIISLRAPRSYLDKNYGSNRVDKQYFTLSGTSMATPLCSSCAVLLLQKYPELTPDQIKKAITSSTVDLGCDSNTQGTGIVDIKQMLEFYEKSLKKVEEINEPLTEEAFEEVCEGQVDAAYENVFEDKSKASKCKAVTGLVISSEDNTE